MPYSKSLIYEVFREFPTGNGKLDIVVRRGKKLYALELKSFKDRSACKFELGELAEKMVRSQAESLSDHHGIEIHPDVVRKAIELTGQHVVNRFHSPEIKASIL